MKFVNFALLVLVFNSPLSIAVERPEPFRIKEIYMAHPANFHFRVISDNPDAWHCNNGPKNPAWSYINEADPGSKGMMSALLTAYASNKIVTLVTEGVDTSVGRVCQIVEFKVSG
ncbi:hypothetical protein K6675_004703 [Vibrio parahaemolyticus]|uniref:hypothetical protein n=1 Tax=Vibrio parahaemolyticus TaxID=670 RepID=UPI0006A730A6|nr:hypothetical protein [Vibrio parahaemolyticus]EHK9101462.1 hypothetical protein [Vibrio parahaemolyticus]EIA1334005.1 hypothetical protein [Vibrio parahaemolyticus]EJE8567897.1 hypothetical protein [Vibrio parahaemolyticus]EJG0980455.1 hypothetical protein [Vibrio parahaemolyticus]EJG1024067.1 hypothetical protein [Vibrio parahaemolyticus]